MNSDQTSDKNTAFSKTMRFNFQGKSLNMSSPLVMGILNLTPDSFYDGGRYQKPSDLISRAGLLLSEGAALVDLGAMSTRPGAPEISFEEEYDRLIPNLKLLVKEFPEALFSVDTYRVEIAKAATEEGAFMINDISGGTFDDNMFDFIGQSNVPYVLMHTTAKSGQMMQNLVGKDVMEVLLAYFEERIKTLNSKGSNQLIIDPGFGFGKTLEANYLILRNLSSLQRFGFPLLAGISRKSMINRVLGTQPEDALNGTTALHMLALEQGAMILRAHDARQAVEVVQLWEAFRGMSVE
jgi:dihydropteroate synthase